MGWGTGVYYNPERLGLEPVGEVDFSDGCYQFDLLAVWKHTDGKLYYAEDQGCSCPSPFEDFTSLDALIEATPHQIAERINERLSSEYAHGHDDGAELIEKVMSAR